jgi:hypothetical protein
MIIPAEKLAGQNSAYRHQKYEGRFRKRRRPSTFCEAERPLSLVKRLSETSLTSSFVPVFVLTYVERHQRLSR